MAYKKEIKELIRKAEELPDGKEKVNLFEQAVKIADLHNDKEAGFDARFRLGCVATFSEHPHISIAVFPWLLARCDEDPEKFKEKYVLGYFKWVIEQMPDMLPFSREQIENAMDEMDRRFTKNNYPQKTVHEFRRIVAMKLGELEQAKKAQEDFLKAPPETAYHLLLGIGNCPACVLNNLIDYHLFIGDTEKAISEAQPILKGKLSCGEVPENTYPKLLLPFLEHDEPFKAEEYYIIGYDLVKEVKKLLKEQSEFLTYAAIKKYWKDAWQMLELHLPQAVESRDDANVFRFYLAGWLFLTGYQSEGNHELRIKLPAIADFATWENGKIPVNELKEWFMEKAEKIGKEFDERNRTASFNEMMRVAKHHVSPPR